jgi:hypothetical protein
LANQIHYDKILVMAETTGPESIRSPRSLSPAATPTASGLFGFAGYALLLYGLYSLVTVMLGGDGRQDTVWARMGQLLSLFPLLFLGSVLIFSSAEARLQPDNIWKAGVRWLVLILATIYLLFIPVSLLNEFNTNQQESNRITRLETLLQKRRKEIMSAITGINNPSEFEQVLKRYPEISNINIVASETPEKIRANIDSDISLAIKQQMNQLFLQNQQRIRRLSATVRNLALGSLITGLSMLSLASRLIPWLGRSSQSFSYTARGIGRWLSVVFRWAVKPAQFLQVQLKVMRRDLLGLLPGRRPNRTQRRVRPSSRKSRGRR